MRDWLRLGAILLVLLELTGNRQALGSEPPDVLNGGRPKLVRIRPGTIVGDRPPASWSHLVVKSLPRLASGDLKTLPRSAFRTATLIRTVILADVGPAPDQPETFVLRRIGIGLCVPRKDGSDVVVQSNRLGDSGVSLGIVESIVLEKAEAELTRGRLIASTPTFALYRGPALMQGDQGPRKVVLSYALLVGPDDGTLRTFVWAQDAERDDGASSTEVVELKPSLVFDCPLDVEAERLLGAVPVSWSFAMQGLPPGQGRIVPFNPSRILTMLRARGGAARLEQTLRHCLMAQPATAAGISSGL
ncbi:MAG: hypothetical protein ACP5XB_24880 [Isosphaeraceae bacterium]